MTTPSYRHAAPALALPLALAITACGARADLGVPDDDGGPTMGFSPLCKGSPSQPTVLESIGEFSDYDRATAIMATGSHVYYSVNDESNDPLAIFRAPIAGGAATPIILGVQGCSDSPFGYGSVVSDGSYLFTPDEEEVSLCSGGSLRVTAYDLTSGALFTLPNPASPVMGYVSQVRAAPGGGALWLYGDATPGGTTSLVRWNGTSTTVLVDVPGTSYDFAVAGNHALVLADKGLYAATLIGPPTVTAVAGVDLTKFAFVGSNATAFFYTEDGTSIERRDAASGEVETIVTNVDVAGEAPDSLWADDDWVYFRMGDSATSTSAQLGRAPVTGGPVEVIYTDSTRDGIDVVTSDSCNVYWVSGPSYDASKPPALFVRGR